MSTARRARQSPAENVRIKNRARPGTYVSPTQVFVWEIYVPILLSLLNCLVECLWNMRVNIHSARRADCTFESLIKFINAWLQIWRDIAFSIRYAKRLYNSNKVLLIWKAGFAASSEKDSWLLKLVNAMRLLQLAPYFSPKNLWNSGVGYRTSVCSARPNRCTNSVCWQQHVSLNSLVSPKQTKANNFKCINSSSRPKTFQSRPQE